MNEYEDGFLEIAGATAEGRLPKDDSSWDSWSPKCVGYSIQDVLDHFAESDSPMPDNVCELLQLPAMSAYSDGVRQISSATIS